MRKIIARPYQLEAVSRLLELRQVAVNGVACESPTGTGKSLMMAMLADRLAGEGRRVMILAHRRELVLGNAKAVEMWTGSKCHVELNTEARTSPMDWMELKGNGGVISASVDTVQGGRLKAMPADLITDLIVDEGHHVRPLTKKVFGVDCDVCYGSGKVENKDKIIGGMVACDRCKGTGIVKEVGSKYYKVKSHFRNCMWYAFSGTFYRSQGRGSKDNIMGKMFDQIYQTGTVFDFIDQGWLVDFVCDHMSAVAVHLDFSKLKTKHVSEKQAQEVWNTHKLEALSALRQGLFDKCQDRPTIIFSPKVQHAAWVTEFIQNADTNVYPTMGPETADYVASYLLGDDNARLPYPEARRISVIDRMRAGMLPWVANQGVFTEGTDVPNIAAIAFCRATESWNLMRQMIGRGLRVLDGVIWGMENATAAERIAAIKASKKPNCLLLDMVGNSQTDVCDLVTPTSLITNPSWSKAQQDLASQYWKVMWEKGIRPTSQQAREEIEHTTSAWMQGVRAMIMESQETVAWEVSRVDLRGDQREKSATVHRELNPSSATDKQCNYLLALCKATRVYDWSLTEIRGMDARIVAQKIGELIAVRNALPCPSWLTRKVREKGLSFPGSWGEGLAMLKQV